MLDMDASMDGASLLQLSSRTGCRCGNDGTELPRGGGSVRYRRFLSGEVVAALSGDGERRARQDGRASSAGFGAAPRLHRRADRANLASDVAPSEGRTGGSRRDGFPQCDLAVHAPGRPELQKKHYLRLSKAASTLPGEERAGRLGKIASIPSGSSSSTKPGSEPTWPRCEVGGRRASDCTALLRMVVGAP